MKKLKFILPSIILIAIIIITVVLYIPKKDAMFINTGIDFQDGKFNVVYNDYAIYNGEQKTEIFEINRKKAELKEYYSFENNNELIDANNEKLLLKDENGYFVFNLKSKKSLRISTKEIPLNNDFNNITCRFSENGESIVVTKVLKDNKKPFKAGKIILGYKLKSNSGVYVYSASNGKKVLETKLDKFGISNTKKLEFSIACIDGDNIGFVIRESAMGTTFYDEYYYSVSTKNGKCSKIGSYSNSESLDVLNFKFSFANYYVNMNSTTVMVVDFKNRVSLKSALPTAGFNQNCIVFLKEKSNSFVISRPNGLGYWECVVSNRNINFKELKSSQFEKNDYLISQVSVGSKIELSKTLLEKIKDKKIDGAYKTYSDNCYLAKSEDKFCIIYK